ncbi:HAD-IIB family hydrolase [Candidatus Margulisiibacteriota bacterium]
MIKKKFNVLMINIHGLLKSSSLELGRDADTGGQTKYVYEYAKELGNHPEIDNVYILTRFISDKRYSPDYALDVDPITDNVQILRIKCHKVQYIKKEKLWPHLDEFVDNALETLIKNDLKVDLIHSHYADAGYVAQELSNLLNIPFIHTGHSLGIPKKKKLAENNVSEISMEIDYKLSHRISVEESIIKNASLIITSSAQEIDKQYSLYNSHQQGKYMVIPPGIDLDKFYPYFYLNDRNLKYQRFYEMSLETRESIKQELMRFLVHPNKPLILTICRPEKRKNIEGLLMAYGLDKELQAMANLAIFAGIRKDISKKSRLEQKILMDMLLLMDKYDLYGKLAIPKKHNFEYEIPELYRYTAQIGGVFINPAFIEPFGLTLLEAAASGVPIVTTNNGGPQEIIKNCDNGILVDVNNPAEISEALKKIISNPDVWQKYSRNGTTNVKKHYSWQPHCEKLINTLKDQNILSTSSLKQKQTGSLKDKILSFTKLIVTDLDNTLIGDDAELSKFLSWLNNNRHQFGFAIATGRNIDSTIEALKENNVSMPDIFITSVGTEIYYHFSNSLISDKRWPVWLNEKWEPGLIRKTLDPLSFLELQKDLREFKISYNLKDYTPDKLQKVNTALKAHNLKYKIVLTENVFLDILPFKASKYKAILHVLNKWKLSPKDTIVCGDAGNDKEMLKNMKNSVIVANYKKELSGLKNVYYSSQKYSGGILDGLKHYNFI